MGKGNANAIVRRYATGGARPSEGPVVGAFAGLI